MPYFSFFRPSHLGLAFCLLSSVGAIRPTPRHPTAQLAPGGAWVLPSILFPPFVVSLLGPQQAGKPSDFTGPVRVAKLLWKANPQNAANTLNKALETGFDRQAHAEISEALKPLEPLANDVVSKADAGDPRYAPSLVIIALLQPDMPLDFHEALPRLANVQEQELAYRAWQHINKQQAIEYFAASLGSAEISSDWSVALTQRALQVDSPAATRILLELWPTLTVEVQLAAIEPMSSSAQSMAALVDAVVQGVVSKDLVNTNQLRKWLAANKAELTEKIEGVWGKIRESDNAERQALVSETLALLRSGVTGSVARGDKVFERVCSQCHQLHGKGFEVGPNITGNGRGNLDQLVSNVLDPSLVIGEAFQAKLVLTYDGEVVAGLVAAEDERYLKIKVQGGKVVEFDKQEDIEQIQASSKSLMPEGIEAQLTQQELVDLFAYLSLLKPLSGEDNELIPGTPDSLVAP